MAFRFFLVLVFIFYSSYAKAEESEEDNVVVIACGFVGWHPESESMKSFLDNEFDLVSYERSSIYAVDHDTLYVISRNDKKITQQIKLKEPKEDWVFDIKVKNSILVISAFSADQQQSKIIRYNTGGSQIRKIDEYLVESLIKDEGDESNRVYAPLAINDKAVFFIETRAIERINIYQVFSGSRNLLSSHSLLNRDLETYDSFLLFADVFKLGIDFRAYTSNLLLSPNKSDGYSVYDFISYDNIDWFNQKESNYSDYSSYLTDNQATGKFKPIPLSYLLTFDLTSERFKIRPFEFLPAVALDIDLSGQQSFSVKNHFFDVSFIDDDTEFRYELTADWKPKSKTNMLHEDGYLTARDAFNKNYFFITDFDQEGSQLNTQLLYREDGQFNLKQMLLSQSINEIKKVGSYLIAKGNNSEGTLTYSIIDGESHQVESINEYQDFVDSGYVDNSDQAIRLNHDRYILPTGAGYKSDSRIYDLYSYEAINENGNGYQLLMLGLSKGKMQLITSLDMNIYDNKHCSSHCDEDLEQFWDNRRVLNDGKQLFILKGSQLDILEFDNNFKYTHSIVNFKEVNGS